MYSIPARFRFTEHPRQITIDANYEIIRYYKWIILREYSWMYMPRTVIGDPDIDRNRQSKEKKPDLGDSGLFEPLYGAHVTALHHRYNTVSAPVWKRLRERYNGKPTSITVYPGIGGGYSRKRDGYWTFMLFVDNSDVRDIQRIAGINPNSNRLHLTIANTKKNLNN